MFYNLIKNTLFGVSFAWLSLCIFEINAQPQTNVSTIVENSNLAFYYPGKDGRAQARMTIVDNQGRKQYRQFSVLRQDIIEGADQRMMVFFSRPADVRGTVFRVEKRLDKEDNRWLYLPSLDLLKRISSGDKRSSFVGSQFFYEDISGRDIRLDEFTLLKETEQDYYLNAKPKNKQQVEFNHYDIVIDKKTMLPKSLTFYDNHNKAYRQLEVLSTAMIQNIPTVIRSKMSDLKTGGHTLLEFRGIEYDIGLPEKLFSERSMKKPPIKWLKRKK